jgi:hypothetical protein
MPIELKALRGIIVRLFNRNTFGDLLYETFKRNLDQFAANVNFDNQVSEVLQILLQEERLEELVIAVADARDQDTELGTLRLQIESSRNAASAPQTDPYERIWLRGGRPFINRRQFRQNVRRLLAPDQTHVLVVRGTSRSGKSYSRWFLEHIAQATRSLDYVLVDLIKLADSKPDLSACDLAQALNLRLKLDYYFSQTADVDGRPFKIEPFMLHMERVLSERSSRPILLVFDGFGQVNLTKPSIEVVERIAQMAEETQYGRLVLALLGFDMDLPPDIHPYVGLDQTCNFSQDDLIDFITQFYTQILRRAKPQLQINESVVASAVAHLLPELSKAPNNVEFAGRATATFCLKQF